ncbi:MAG: hypothetical protein NC924_05985 [Candidatus Omnitrophica bacterium]|nr:hypothetical protein [Candidatus Omnitrophota bacterium]
MNTAVHFFLVMGIIAAVAGATDAYALFSKKSKANAAAPAAVEKSAAPAKSPAAPVPPAPEKKPDVPAAAPHTETAVESAPAPQPAAKSADPAKKAREAKRAQLEKTRWEIELIPLSGKGEHSQDALVFDNNQVYSENGQNRGLPATNYTLSLQEEQLIWETMQTSSKGETVFWRGEMDAPMKEMRGVMSWQVEPGKSADYSFISRKKTAVTPSDK